MYTHNVGRDRIIIDADVAYAGDAEFDVSVAGFKGGLDQLQVVFCFVRFANKFFISLCGSFVQVKPSVKQLE